MVVQEARGNLIFGWQFQGRCSKCGVTDGDQARLPTTEMNPSSRTRVICLLLLYFAVVFPGGALLAPGLYQFAHWAGGQWSAVSAWTTVPFPRCLDRALLGLAIICLWPMLRLSGIRSWRELGFVREKAIARHVFGGFALGWASLAFVALLAVICGASTFVGAHSTGEIFRHLLNATWAACLVAVLEELIFRGALFGLLRRAMPWPAALVASSAVYSAVHFIQKTAYTAPVQWNSGLDLLWTMLCHPPPLIPAFLTLLMAGSILALCYQRTGALYISIGLHAGWIFWLKSYSFLFRAMSTHPSFWGTDKLIDGWLSFFVLTIMFALIARKLEESRAEEQRAAERK